MCYELQWASFRGGTEGTDSPSRAPDTFLSPSGPLLRRHTGFRRRLPRFDSEQRPFLFRSQHVEQTVGTLAHVADALFEFHEHRLAPQFFPVLVEDDPLNLTG